MHWHFWGEGGGESEREDCLTFGQYIYYNAQYLRYHSFKHCITYNLRMQCNWITTPNPNSYMTCYSTQYHTSCWNTVEHRTLGCKANKLETKFKLSTLLTNLMYFQLSYIHTHTHTHTHTWLSAKKMHAEPQTAQDMLAINILIPLLLLEAPISLLHFHPHVKDTHFKRNSAVT